MSDGSFHVDSADESIAIEVTGESAALQVTLFDFSSNLPAGAKLILPKSDPVKALRALLTELYVNEEVYAALLADHLGQPRSKG